ncbi:hypothetical protein [Mesorhizobium sp. M1027]|uniref:lipase family alpha/beta hydrolase n=1 Tax=Mesorhizobium sp. M1027 TaxID=2957050 RepID=UPI003336BCC4
MIRTTRDENRDLILFVHGLFGSPRTTWGALFELVKSDIQLDNWDIDAFEFPSTFFRRFLRRTANITELAAGLSTAIRASHADRRRIKIIAHSLGGIVVRKYIVDQVKAGNALTGIEALLLASPSTGSDMASLGQRLIPHNRHLKQLHPHADALHSLNEDWKALKIEDRVEVHYAAGGADAVVYPESALPTLTGPKHSLIPSCDHSSIVRPSSYDDISYKIIRKFVLSKASVHEAAGNLSNNGIKVPDPLFDIYHAGDEAYYLSRPDDDNILRSVLSGPLWISGDSGVGKTSLARRVVIRSGWKLQHIMLGGYSALDVNPTSAFLREAIGLETGSYATSNDVPALTWELKTAISSSQIPVRCFLVEEIPVSGQQLLDFISSIVNITSQFDSDSKLRDQVRFVFTSIADPDTIIPTGQTKTRERISFTRAIRWKVEHIRGLLNLIKPPTGISLSTEDDESVIRSADGMPRFVKHVLRDIRDRRTTGEGLADRVKRLDAEGKL